MVGKTLLHYNILKQLGKGGMGEVYLAEDTRLKRQVAIKVLPESLRGSPDRLARFRTEAEAAARLKHPNIAPIFALEDADGQLFIVMEYVEGQPLYAHIPQDGMDIETFFSIFIPLSDALAHAHTHDVTHRDIKPGNIMIAEDGTPKILDFGLARITRPEPEETPDAVDSDAPTLTMDPNVPLPQQEAPQAPPKSLTEGMQFMGTPAYMSPEQAQRQRVDHRTDLFSLGVVMYEALTGKRPFQGDTLESLIGHILVADPKPVTTVKPVTPYTLWQVTRMCLQKNRDERIQMARQLHTELRHVQEEVQSGTVLVDARTMPKPEPVPLWRRPIPIAVMLVLALAIGLIAAWILKPVSEPPLRKFTLTVDPVLQQAYDGPAISPDGTMIAYRQDNTRRLWIRDLDSVTPRELPGTEGGERPFWSPNSDFVGYFASGGLWKVAATAGSGIPLCEGPVVGVSRGGVWKPDGTIVFGIAAKDFYRAGVLYTVPSQGGEPSVFAVADSSLDQRGVVYPTLLPDGSLLYAAAVGEDDGSLVVQQGRERRVILPSRGERMAFPVYSSTGHIVYQRGFPESKGVWAVPFDAGSLRVNGDRFPIDANGGYPTVSSDGTLVYRSVNTTSSPPGQLVWVDQQGRTEPVGEVRQGLGYPALSPDGRRVAFSASTPINPNIYVYDLERDTATRLTFGVYDDVTVWSPDGRWIAFCSYRSGFGDMYVRAADGSGDTRLLVGGPGVNIPTSWVGRHLLYDQSDSTGWDLWYAVPRAEDSTVTLDGSSQPFLRTPHNEREGCLSPDGRYLAYASDESGRYEVYVRSFPDGGGKMQISSDGGVYPRWGAKGKELFYIEEAMVNSDADRGPMMAVPVETTGPFRRGRVRRLFNAPEDVDLVASMLRYDISADGRRFLAVQRGGKAAQPQITITVVQNWAVRSN